MVKFKGSEVALNAASIKAGDTAPEVTLVNNSLQTVQVGGSKNKAQLILAVPSLDTGVCATQSKVFNEKVSALDVEGFIVSMDLPFASGRFCQSESISKLQAVSDFRNKAFSKEYGLLMQDSPLEGLCARAVFVVDKGGKVVYSEVVEEVTTEPNYDKALEALTSIL